MYNKHQQCQHSKSKCDFGASDLFRIKVTDSFSGQITFTSDL